MNAEQEPIDGPLAVLALLAVGAGGLLLASPSLLADLFGGDLNTVGEFLVRRYGASGAVAVGVAAALAALGRPARTAVFGGAAAWFFVQGFVALLGTVSGQVASFGWIAVAADPAAGLLSLWLARSRGETGSEGPGAAEPDASHDAMPGDTAV